MKKLALLLVAAAGLLALAGTAQAKEIVGFKLCGATGCNESSDHIAIDSSTSLARTQPAAFYEVELRFGDGQQIIHRETAYWLPDSGYMRFQGDVNGSWWKPADLSGMHKAATGIDAFTPELSKVTVKGKTAADPSSYLRLLGTFPYRAFPKAKLHLISIKLTASKPNPWVSGTMILRYDAQRRLLIRPDGYYKLPVSLGKLVVSRASLNSKASSGSGGGRTALYAGLGVSALAAVAVLGIARHKKMT
jgi:hypothetical protein